MKSHQKLSLKDGIFYAGLQRRMITNRRNNNSKQSEYPHGFSFIELLISSTIILLLILGTAQALIYSIFIKSKVHAYITATELAKTRLEYFKSLAFEDLELQPTVWTETISQSNNQSRYQIKGKISGESTSLKRIEIECHSDLHPQKRMRVVLLISKQLGF
jgi:prepilin-type N-terminal cleavage/methylation domain-containing protein